MSRRKPVQYRRGYEKPDHSPNDIQPRELTFYSGNATITVDGVTSVVNNGITVYETVNTTGQTTVNHSIANAADGHVIKHAELLTRRVRYRNTGEIVGTYDNVYNWTERSITLLSRGTLVEGGTSYPLHPNVGTLSGTPQDTFDGEGPVNRLQIIHFPYAVEVYDPINPAI